MGRVGSTVIGLGLVAVCLALTLLFPVLELPSRAVQRLHEFAHVPLFALVTAGLALVYPGRVGDTVPARLRRLFRLSAVAVLLGGVVEMAQPRWGGTAEIGDLVRDASGAGVTVLALVALWPGVPRRIGWLLRGAAGAILLLFLAPVLTAAWDETLAHRQFPLLAGFETPFEVTRFSHHRCDLKVIPTAGEDGGRHLQATFLPGEFPRFQLRYGPSDWRGYRALAFTCVNPSAESFFLTIRLDDVHHDRRMADRYTVRAPVGPGRHEFEIPLSAVEAAPDRRPMDLGAMSGPTLYGYRLRKPHTLLFDDFRLLP
jgi:hypothetical protein